MDGLLADRAGLVHESERILGAEEAVPARARRHRRRQLTAKDAHRGLLRIVVEQHGSGSNANCRVCEPARGERVDELRYGKLKVVNVASVDRLEVDIADRPQVVGAVLEDIANSRLQLLRDCHHDLLVVLLRPP
jgi:uncharacterized protein (UPF0548 family)